jgi:D-serine deaminase-like pyridoxal phosphate-dependent protein
VTLDQLDSPQLLIDLDTLDANLERMRSAFRDIQPLDLRVHFKSLKCGGLARHLLSKGVTRFLCAKLNEAEVLADAGVADIFLANQIIGAQKLKRLCELARRVELRVCVDDAGNVEEMGRAAQAAGVVVGVLVEVDVGMGRCGVEPGPPALELVRHVCRQEGLRFDGLQGYDGHLQMLPDAAEQRRRCLEGLEQLIGTRRLLEDNGIAVAVVTGAGTGTCEVVGHHDGVTEIQPGSFLLMDSAYHAVRPEFGCALSILATVVSRRPGWYVLDAGSKAISQDFGKPVIKGRPEEKVVKLSEEHAKVEDGGAGPRLGERREVLPAHCCATMNLHRQCVAHRGGRVEAFWPIEASGRYD